MRLNRVARRAAKVAVLPLGSRRRNEGDLLILLYHRLGTGPREIDLPVTAFRRQLEIITATDRPVSIDDIERSKGGLVVSFDDGYRDFHELALPSLVEHRVPAVLYLTTGNVSDGAGNGSLSWGHLRDAVATGLVTVGAHTHTHPNLSRVSAADCENELYRSKSLIEDRLQTHCRHFAYPFGVSSPLADGLVRKTFDTAAIGDWKINRAGRVDRYRLSRVPVLQSDGDVFFKAKLRGLLTGEAALYRAARRGPWAS